VTRAEMQEVLREHHYTHSVPAGKSHYYCFDDVIVVFSIPANKNISSFFLGEPNIVWELARLWAPENHAHNLLTTVLSKAVTAFRQEEPTCQALVSYADPNVGHEGYVYKAASWVALGRSEERRYYRGANGEVVSRRKFHSGSHGMTKQEIEAQGFTEFKLPGKLRYGKGFTRKARRQLKDLQERTR